MGLSWIRKRDDQGAEQCCCPDCDAVQDDPQLTYCTACGYDLVLQAKADTARDRPIMP